MSWTRNYPNVWSCIRERKRFGELLANLEPNDVLFIDEIHRLNAVLKPLQP